MNVRPIAGGVEVLAPAKLNLFLEILSRRPDGYHEIETLMVAIDLHDRLSFADEPSGSITLRCDDATLPTGPENLVVRAAERLRADANASGRSNRPLGATIELRKSIPAEAGLAGGSSDAAATLTALDHLWDLRTPAGRLDELAGEIGSDVTFFRHAPAALCRGRGERVQALRMPGAYHFVLVCPPTGVRTADVYANLTPPEEPRGLDPVLDAFHSGDPARLGPLLFNRLQPVAERIHPALGRVRTALEDLGPSLDGHLLSGSGAAYFGLARDGDAAQQAARRLDSLGLVRVRVATSGP
ncbi:4-(cytidine 5'-diphospho)-2-C-methyl-D-erythritol kinase [soil metagenome]